MARRDVITTAGPLPARKSRGAAGRLTVTVRMTSAGQFVVTVGGEVDGSTSSLLRERVFGPLRSARHLVLDLSDVSLLCAAGLTTLVVIRERALVTGAGLCVVARTRPVRLPLIITGLTGLLDLHVDVGEALLCTSAPESSPPGVRLADPRQPGDLR